MYSTAQEIIQYIRDAKKQTPVKVYVNGHDLPCDESIQVFGTETSRVLIGDLENVDSGNKPTVNNNVNTSKLPQTGAVNVLFTLALGGVSITIGGISLKKKKL